MSNNIPNAYWPGWETGELIGRGSFGAVYEIHRQIFDDRETAALKVISIPQHSTDIEEMYEDGYDDESITSAFHTHLKNIVAEYSLMRKMSGSANIVNCDDVRYTQHADGIGWDIFIKMELLKPLVKALPESCSEQTVIKVGMDICSALELCRQHNIIHRDIKPQNIFVSKNGNYKLGDFGIAKTVEKTSGGTKIGTYNYMAPEVYNNQPYGHVADIYSLGLVLYWMLNLRRLPFMPLPPEKPKVGMEESARSRRFSGELLPAPYSGSDELKRIILKACAFDPGDRYQTAQDMLDDLTALSSGKTTVPPVVVPPDNDNLDIPDNDVQKDTPSGFAAFIKNLKDHPSRFLVCAAVVFCLIFGIVFFAGRLVRSGESPYSTDVVRLYGEDRFDSSLKIADLLKESLGVSKFSAVVIANSQNYPDAISGACLANKNSAPILLVNESTVDLIADYVKENLQQHGTVYILGDPSVVPEALDHTLSSFDIIRLGGKDRFETNLLVLEATKVTAQELVICSSDSYADGLIAASLNKPVMLVGSTLTDSQREFLEKMAGNLKLYIVGGTGAVSNELMTELLDYGTAIRVSGTNRFETSVNVAQKFFDKPDYLVLIFNDNFSDGLCAIPLAMHEHCPLLLISPTSNEFAIEYANFNNIQYGIVISSPETIPDKLVSEIFNMKSRDSILVNP